MTLALTTRPHVPCPTTGAHPDACPHCHDEWSGYAGAHDGEFELCSYCASDTAHAVETHEAAVLVALAARARRDEAIYRAARRAYDTDRPDPEEDD